MGPKQHLTTLILGRRERHDMGKNSILGKGNILLIHGTWCNGGNWGEFAAEFERRGYTVHTPSYRYHGKPGDIDIWGNAQKIAKLGLLDYVADLVDLVDTMDSPPMV